MFTHKIENVNSNQTESGQVLSHPDCTFKHQNLVSMARITDLPNEIRAQIVGYLLYCPTEKSVAGLIEIVGLARISDRWEAVARRELRNEVNNIIREKGRLLNMNNMITRDSSNYTSSGLCRAAVSKHLKALVKMQILKRRIDLLKACLDDIWDEWGEANIAIALWKRDQKLHPDPDLKWHRSEMLIKTFLAAYGSFRPEPYSFW